MTNYVAKKKYGQNFLKDKSVLIKIIDNVKINEDDLIIEIGPGQGALTKYLKLFKANLVCYEIDNDLTKYLNSFIDEKTKIIYKDFLESDVLNDIRDIKYNNLYIIANLPYYITTPIIDKIINSNINPRECVFMVQDEVANRLCSKKGNKDYGYISVILDYYFIREKLFVVNRKSFDPIPNVDSAVIKFTKRDSLLELNDYSKFERLVHDAFHMKRKNLKNNLKGYDLDILNRVLDKYGYSLQDRAENIDINCFIEMANTI